MRDKPVEWRHQARQDAADTARWYVEQAGLPLAERFLSQLEATLEKIARFPAVGSTRHSDVVFGLPAPLRFFPVSGFERHLIYYLDLPSHVDVIRIWDASRGLQALMAEPDSVLDAGDNPCA